MSTEPVVIGAYSALYVGNAAPDSEPLTPIDCQRTKGSTIRDFIPENFEDVVANTVQSGRAEMSLDFRFIGNPDFAVIMSRGLSIYETDMNAVCPFQQYSILAVDPDMSGDNHIYIPICSSKKELRTSKEKSASSETPVFLFHYNRNTFIKLYYRGSLSYLETKMGTKNPLV